VRDGAAVEGAIGGIPFPIPQSGMEVMWNHLLRYGEQRGAAGFPGDPLRGGSYTLVDFDEEFLFNYYRENMTRNSWATRSSTSSRK